MGVLLAIETSQRTGSVALRAESGTVHNEPLRSAKRHDDDLMPAIDRLFARLDLPPRVMSAVAVSIGPGGFTGLRIAVSTARMFAEAIGAKVIAVPSALVAAEGTDLSPLLPLQVEPAIMVALAAKHDTFWATRLRRDERGWKIIGEPGMAHADAMDLDGAAAILADEHLPPAGRTHCEAASVPIIEPAFEATACLRAAEGLAAEGRFTDPLALLPLYPRPPEAVSIWEARQEKLA